VPAVEGALVGDPEEHPVGVAVDQIRQGLKALLPQGIGQFPRARLGFLNGWNALPSDGIILGAAGQLQVILGDREGQPRGDDPAGKEGLFPRVERKGGG
jgi:hypothetical protein